MEDWVRRPFLVRSILLYRLVHSRSLYSLNRLCKKLGLPFIMPYALIIIIITRVHHLFGGPKKLSNQRRLRVVASWRGLSIFRHIVHHCWPHWLVEPQTIWIVHHHGRWTRVAILIFVLLHLRIYNLRVHAIPDTSILISKFKVKVFQIIKRETLMAGRPKSAAKKSTPKKRAKPSPASRNAKNEVIDISSRWAQPHCTSF